MGIPDQPGNPGAWKNQNRICTDGWSNPATAKLYNQTPGTDTRKERPFAERHSSPLVCGGCSFFARFSSSNWGLCFHRKSPHYLETINWYFACAAGVLEGYGPHSFSEDKEDHCCCDGGPDLRRAYQDLQARQLTTPGWKKRRPGRNRRSRARAVPERDRNPEPGAER